MYSIGQYYTGPALHRDVKEIMDELNANPRHFQQIRFQTVGTEKYVIFMGYLGLFWVECLQKPVHATFVYTQYFGESDLGSYNKLKEFTDDIMKRCGAKEEASYRLYNDIMKAAEK